MFLEIWRSGGISNGGGRELGFSIFKGRSGYLLGLRKGGFGIGRKLRSIRSSGFGLLRGRDFIDRLLIFWIRCTLEKRV